jgi:hypothetical protein
MTKGSIHLKISVFLLLSMFFLSGAKVPVKSGGRVTHLSGTANVKLKQIVIPGQSVITGKTGRVELTFSDGSRLRIGPASNFQLVLHNPAQQRTVAKLAQGSLWSKIKPGKGKKIMVQGRHSTAAVMGTTYALSVNNTQTSTTVLEGNVGVHRPFEFDTLQTADQALNLAPSTFAAPTAPPPSGPPQVIEKPFHQIPNPVKVVPGPYEVSPDQWLQIIQNQRINMRDNGQAQIETIDPKALASADEWFQWNQRMDTQTVKTE